MATSTLGSGTLVLAGTTSGTTTVTATAVAGTTTLTLPAATDTLVGKATTDTLTNKTLTGAVMNGTLGATTPSTVAATTLTTSSTVTHNGGTANGVAYLDGSKVLTTGSALVFDGTNLGVGVTPSAWFAGKTLQLGNDGAVSAYGQQTELSTNSYLSGGGTYKYMTNGLATRYSSTSGQHQWFNAASGTAGNTITFTQAMTLDASGNLGVGNTSPSTAIGGQKGIAINGGATSAQVRLQDNGSGTAGSDGLLMSFAHPDAYLYNYESGSLIFGTNNTERARIDSSGNFFVNNMAVGGAANLHWSSGNGQFFVTSSSRRFKHDIVEYDKGLAELMQMQPKYFVYNDEPNQKQRAGFIAEDFHDLGMTEYVEYWKDDEGNDTPSEIGYSNMVAILVKSIQEQQALITTLTARITALEGA